MGHRNCAMCETEDDVGVFVEWDGTRPRVFCARCVPVWLGRPPGDDTKLLAEAAAYYRANPRPPPAPHHTEPTG